jgi:hypothetical protein
MRSANREALKPQPTHQAKLVVWYLMYCVPLYWAAIPDTEIAKACERFNLPLETWLRQERAFGLLKEVYSRRAQLRGQQPLNGGRRQLQRAEIIEQPQEPAGSPVAKQPASTAEPEQPITARPASNTAQQEPQNQLLFIIGGRRLSQQAMRDAEQPIRADDGVPRLR